MRPRLYLVDAHAYLHRAYHALPPLTGPQGEPVGALYGFARMLLQLVKREKPGAIAVCFDTPEPTFRHKAYPEYKATRKEIDGDLLAQLKQARGLAQAMGFACVELPGYEADDIMATLARRGSREGFDAVLVTGDKDALQMVGPGIRVLRDVTKGVWMDSPQIEEKLGVGPSAVADYLALNGDASDNVPGVRGIGPVGAAKLIRQFGGVEGILKAAKAGDPGIAPKTAKAIVEGEQGLLTALSLVRLKDDAPVTVEPAQCKLSEPEPEKLAEAFTRLGFNSLLREMLPGSVAVDSAAPSGGAAQPDRAERGPVAPRLQSSVGVVEREASLPQAAAAPVEKPFHDLLKHLKQADQIIVAAARNPERDLAENSAAFLALGLPDGRIALLDESQCRSERQALSGLLRGKALKSSYDLKETLGALDLLGLELAGPFFDTMLAAYCLNPARPKAEASAAGGWRAALSSRFGKALGAEALRESMRAAGVLELYERVELPLIPVLREMEDEGIAVDEPYLRGLSSEFERDIQALKEELDRLAGVAINVNSPKQLAELLFDTLGLPVVHKTAKGGRSTDEGALQALAARHPIPGKVLEYRELSKLKSTYIDGLLERLDPKTRRVHTRFDQTGTETGRLSSLNPNLQNIPIRTAAGRKIRRAFVARPGSVLVSADYSQIDLRVLAHVSGDAVLMDSFEKNEDIHLRTACEVFHVPAGAVDKELRRRAKAVNFGIVYGQTAFGLAAQLGIPQKEAAAIIERYFERYAGVAAWFERNLEDARRELRVRTILGRVRHLPELAAKNAALRQFAERAARNTPIQGGSADVIKLAMLDVYRGLKEEGFKAKLLLQIHDELLFEVPKGELEAFSPWVAKTMEAASRLKVPLVVDVKAGANWQDMGGAR